MTRRCKRPVKGLQPDFEKRLASGPLQSRALRACVWGV